MKVIDYMRNAKNDFKKQENKGDFLFKAIITFCLSLIITSNLLRCFVGGLVSLTDDCFVVFCGFIFLKELLSLKKRNFWWLLVFTVWLLGTFFVSVFSSAPGYYLTIFVYLKPIFLIAGLLVLFRENRVDFAVIEKVVLFAACYAIIQFLFFYFFKIFLPGSGHKLILIGGHWFLRAGGVCGHPVIFSFMLFPIFVVYFIKKKYVRSALIFLALALSFSRWSIFLAFLVCLLLSSRAQRLFLSSLIVFLTLLYGWSFYREYKQVYKNYNEVNTLKLYGMDKGMEIFTHNPLVGTGIGSFGSKYSADSDIYQEYEFDRGMLSVLKNATSGIESGVVIILVENGILFGILYLMLIFQSFSIAKSFVAKKIIFVFFVLYIISTIFYHPYHPEFIITFLMSMWLLGDIGKNSKYDENFTNKQIPL